MRVSSGFGPGATLEGVYYFSALAHHLGELNVVRRHKTLIEAMQDSGVSVALSHVPFPPHTKPPLRQP